MNERAKVSVLFVCRQSHYKLMPACDCYDERRDALTYAGTMPVVVHPPCRTWGSLRFVSTLAPAGEHELGPWAIEQVRRCGGVLEHPAGSTLFDHCRCPKIGAPVDKWGGFSVGVDQFHWGHKAAKPTRLYIVGAGKDDLPPIPHRAGTPTHCITQGHGVRVGHPLFKSRVTDYERKATPPAFAEWLVEIAGRCKKPQKQGVQ